VVSTEAEKYTIKKNKFQISSFQNKNLKCDRKEKRNHSQPISGIQQMVSSDLVSPGCSDKKCL